MPAANEEDALSVGLWAEPKGEHLFVSHDGGATFSESAGPPDPLNGAAAIATPRPSATVLASASLVASFDGGGSWSTVYGPDPARGDRVSDLGFTTPSQCVAVAGDPNQRSVLLRSGDGGHTWNPVAFP